MAKNKDLEKEAIEKALQPHQTVASKIDISQGCVEVVTYPDYQKIRVYHEK